MPIDTPTPDFSTRRNGTRVTHCYRCNESERCTVTVSGSAFCADCRSSQCRKCHNCSRWEQSGYLMTHGGHVYCSDCFAMCESCGNGAPLASSDYRALDMRATPQDPDAPLNRQRYTYRCGRCRPHCAVCNTHLDHGSAHPLTRSYARSLSGGRPTQRTYRACSDCLRNGRCFQCAECGGAAPPDFFSTVGGNRFCGDCREECSQCHTVTSRSGMRTDEDNQRVCHACYVPPILGHADNPLSTGLQFQGFAEDGLYLGTELEMEINYHHGPIAQELVDRFNHDTSRHRSYKARQILELVKQFAVIKHDGSLSHGFEVVSAPASLDAHSEMWGEFFTKITGLGMIVSPRCGMHVHLSKAALKPSQIGRMMVFLHDPHNRKFVEQVAGRSLSNDWGRRYCNIVLPRRVTDAGIREHQSRAYHDHDPLDPFTRYAALNNNNPHTVEIRIFQGTLSRVQILRNLEFCHALAKYCAPGVTSLRRITMVTEFAGYVTQNRKSYPNLYAWLVSKGYVKSKHKPKPTESAKAVMQPQESVAVAMGVGT